MNSILSTIQIIISVLLIAAVLLQQRGEGLSSAFGGSGGGVYQTRRGIEKWLHYATIVLAVLFLASAFLNLVI